MIGGRWFLRELERRERAWAEERAHLIATICHLASRPLPSLEPEADLPEPVDEEEQAIDLGGEPLERSLDGDDLLVAYDQE